MKRQFKSKSKHRLSKLCVFIFFLLLTVFLGMRYTYKYFNKLISDKVIIDYLLGQNDINISQIIDFTNPNFVLNYALGMNYKEKETKTVSSEYVGDIEGDYMEDPKPEEINKPNVYLYNTHQTEAYQKNYLEPYSIKPTIMLASYMLREYLNDLGIPTIVETNEVKKVLNDNNWSYGKSYRVSRTFLENAYNQNASLKIFIDLHRDSSKYEKTTLDINGKKYARVLFVVGLEHNNYEANLQNANLLNDLIKRTNEKLSRGIMKKSGQGVNGKYNQDFNPNTFLIEMGGQYNSIEEVKNTTKILADAIYDYIGDLNEKEKK